MRYPDPTKEEDEFSELIQGVYDVLFQNIEKVLKNPFIDPDKILITDAFYTDALTARIRRRLLAVIGSMNFLPSFETTFSQKLGGIALGINAHQTKGFKKQMGILGIDIRQVPPGGTPVDSFIVENTKRIQSMVQSEIQVVSQIINENPTLTRHQISEKIQARVPSTKAQAGRIARNEVLTLQGSLDEQRQKALGITKFMWNTMGDEKVRDSHAELDGKIFSWDDLPEIDGELVYPKSPTVACINCRCYASPVL
jgi:SPP1 gp7 family putative phage head morphogenesis protein